MTVTITGGTGLIGKALKQLLLQKGYKVFILTRGKKVNEENVEYVHWDIAKQEIDKRAITETDHIIHLAGAGIADKRWTKKRKREIVESRTKSGEFLVNALKTIPNDVKTVVSASAIGWYGPDPVVPNPNPFVETAPSADNFLGNTCRAWESSIAPVATLGKRLVIFRTGIVLSKEGGALKEFIKPIHVGVGAILGSGKQMISWIHIDDICRLYVEAIENNELSGIYNAASSTPVTNKELVMQLASRIRGRFFIPMHVPAFVLKTMVGELSIEVLKSTTVSNKKIRRAGFQFAFPTIDSAIEELVPGS
jgi:uncharacterized protein